MTPRDQFPNLQSLLGEIQKRPEMFLGQKSVVRLGTWLDGIRFAEHLHDVSTGLMIHGFDETIFEQWVEEKFNPRRLTLSSFWLAEHLAKSDTEAFELWFKWYDEFTARQKDTVTVHTPV